MEYMSSRSSSIIQMYKRENSNKRGYDRMWSRLRKMFLADNPLCYHCADAGSIKIADVVHHILPIEEFPESRLDPDNLMSLCRDCHEKEHGRKAGKVKIDKDGFPIDPNHIWNKHEQ